MPLLIMNVLCFLFYPIYNNRMSLDRGRFWRHIDQSFVTFGQYWNIIEQCLYRRPAHLTLFHV